MTELGRIDKAFLTVERAMPAGYALSCLGWRHGVWVAEARAVAVRGYRLHREITGRKWGKDSAIQADGLTPQEALLNLSDLLDAFRQNTHAARKHDAVDTIVEAVFGRSA